MNVAGLLLTTSMFIIGERIIGNQWLALQHSKSGHMDTARETRTNNPYSALKLFIQLKSGLFSDWISMKNTRNRNRQFMIPEQAVTNPGLREILLKSMR
jgi:hypothetical protein